MVLTDVLYFDESDTLTVGSGVDVTIKALRARVPPLLARWSAGTSNNDYEPSTASVSLASSPLFTVMGSLTLTDVILSAGSSQNGGAISIQSSGSLLLSGVEFQWCASSAYGGALYNEVNDSQRTTDTRKQGTKNSSTVLFFCY